MEREFSQISQRLSSSGTLYSFQDPKNKDCLLRLYFGQEESIPNEKKEWRDSLRNFELTLNLANDMDLDVKKYVQEMGLGLAILHWQAQIDCNDCE